MEKYLEPLPENTTLQIFNKDQLVFESSGKWLHPLFDADKFFSLPENKTLAESKQLSSHDTAIGKAAAVLTVRLGITKIHANLLSQKAKDYIEEVNKTRPEENKIQLSWDNLIPQLMCATEDLLSDMEDSDQIYTFLRQRAKLVQGVEVSVTNLIHPYISSRSLSFNVKAGGHLMILGENGTGKTTLLRLLAGINKAEGILIDEKKPEQLEKFAIGYIPQVTDSTEFSLNVEEVVSLGLPKAFTPRQIKNNKEAVLKALERTGSLNLRFRDFNTLSGGEKQKIHLSRCLAQKAKLLLLDEPTAALDTQNRQMVINILRSLTISEIPTIIVVTHDSELTKMPGWEILKLGESDDR